ncbi:MAG TPA: lipoyl(octanoyl) transferase LipB [Bacteroidales bacterium]|jgi:lipoyl(octanoyl) transferase|nr:lipoyl(octanoyl) transferase LipB [Bacteroidales bacterium]
MKFVDWELIDYQVAWDKQKEIFNHIIECKSNGQETQQHERIIFCEHPHVYTLGKSGKNQNLLISEDFLKKIDAKFYPIDRGGDITYHGPGQIVGYPILDLENHHISLKQYIFKLEEAIIATLREYQIEATRLQGATGVWLDAETKQARKICAIGVKASRFVTMHGFAFNINTNLNYFQYINPCGFIDKGVTSLQKELNYTIDIEEVKQKLKQNLYKQFGEIL